MEILILLGKGIVGIVIGIFSKNKLSEIFYAIQARRKNDYIFNKSYEGNKADKLMDDLYNYYEVDKVKLYYFKNGKKASNGYSFYKFSLLIEKFDKYRFRSTMKAEQDLPIGMMMDFLVHFRDEGMVICPSLKNYEGSIPKKNIEFLFDSMNVKSTYSMAFKDLKGNMTCALVMNMESEEKEITDFIFFNKIGEMIGELMTEKK